MLFADDNGVTRLAFQWQPLTAPSVVPPIRDKRPWSDG
jgi:hypothetical protein